MRMIGKNILLFLVLLCGVGMVYAAETPKTTGGATPEELMTRLSTAFRNGDRDEMARCTVLYDSNPQLAGMMMDMIMVLPQDLEGSIIDGVKKYGCDKFVKALDDCLIVFWILTPRRPDYFALMQEKGVLTTTDTSAEYCYTVGKQGDELLTTQPQLRAFTISIEGSGMTNESVNFVKVGDRWFLPGPNEQQQKELPGIHKVLADYVKQFRSAVAASKNIPALTVALAKPNATMRAALGLKPKTTSPAVKKK